MNKIQQNELGYVIVLAPAGLGTPLVAAFPLVLVLSSSGSAWFGSSRNNYKV